MPQTPDSPTEHRPSALSDRWWWSGALWILAGGAVAWYQKPVIDDGTAIWANWVMVVVGVAIAAVGALRLWRAWQAQGAPRDEDAPGGGTAGS